MLPSTSIGGGVADASFFNSSNLAQPMSGHVLLTLASNLANFAAASDSDSAKLVRVVGTVGFGTGTSLCGG